MSDELLAQLLVETMADNQYAWSVGKAVARIIERGAEEGVDLSVRYLDIVKLVTRAHLEMTSVRRPAP